MWYVRGCVMASFAACVCALVVSGVWTAVVAQQSGDFNLEASLAMPAANLILYAAYDSVNDVVVAVVKSAIGNGHVLLFDRALTSPPLMDAVVLQVGPDNDPTPTPFTSVTCHEATTSNIPRCLSSHGVRGRAVVGRVSVWLSGRGRDQRRLQGVVAGAVRRVPTA